MIAIKKQKETKTRPELCLYDCYPHVHAMIENARKIIQLGLLKGSLPNENFEVSVKLNKDNLNVDFVTLQTYGKKTSEEEYFDFLVTDGIENHYKDFSSSDFEDLTEDDIAEFEQWQDKPEQPIKDCNTKQLELC